MFFALVIVLLSIDATANAVLICLFSGYCQTTSDCVPGSVCSVEPNGFYSQCIEDTSCVLKTYGQPCTVNANCCSGACTGGHCSNPVNCVRLTGFIAPTKSPSFKPMTNPTTLTPYTAVAPIAKPSSVVPSIKTTAKPSAVPSSFTPMAKPSSSSTKKPTANPSAVIQSSTKPTWTPSVVPSRIILPSINKPSSAKPSTLIIHISKPSSSVPSTKPTTNPSTAAVPLSIVVKPSIKPSTTVPSSAKSSATLTTLLTPSTYTIFTTLYLNSSLCVILPICRNGGFCRKTSDCAPGNKCVVSPYNSQCVEDTTQYLQANCVADYGGCANQSPCCNPGAFCGVQPGSTYKQCLIPQVSSPFNLCRVPDGYLSSSPSTKPLTALIPAQNPTASPSTVKSTAKPRSAIALPSMVASTSNTQPSSTIATTLTPSAWPSTSESTLPIALLPTLNLQ
eukprot:gene37596-49227_t